MMFTMKKFCQTVDVTKFYLNGYSQHALIKAILADGYKPSWAGEIHLNVHKKECQSSWIYIKSLCQQPNYRLIKLTVNGETRESHHGALNTYMVLIEIDWKIFDLVSNNKDIPDMLHKLAFSISPIMFLAVPLSMVNERSVAATNAYIHILLGHLPSGKRLHLHRERVNKPLFRAYSNLLKNRPDIKFGEKAFRASKVKTFNL